MTALPYWSIPVDELVKKVNSSTNGLSQDTAQEVLAQTGPNSIQPKKRATPLRLSV